MLFSSVVNEFLVNRDKRFDLPTPNTYNKTPQFLFFYFFNLFSCSQEKPLSPTRTILKRWSKLVAFGSVILYKNKENQYPICCFFSLVSYQTRHIFQKKTHTQTATKSHRYHQFHVRLAGELRRAS